ncbi:hypothetical protein H0H93_004293, partial [Arthromyces matolae]
MKRPVAPLSKRAFTQRVSWVSGVSKLTLSDKDRVLGVLATVRREGSFRSKRLFRGGRTGGIGGEGDDEEEGSESGTESMGNAENRLEEAKFGGGLDDT